MSAMGGKRLFHWAPNSAEAVATLRFPAPTRVKTGIKV